MENQNNKIQDLTPFVADDDPVSRLLGSLKRVDAPNDFNFRVKARIASGHPLESARSWLPASVRYAVPLVLLLFAGGYFALNALYTPVTVDAPVVASVPSEKITPVAETPSSIAGAPAESPSAVKTGENPAKPTVAAVKESEKNVLKPNPKADRPSGGSLVMASNAGQTITANGVEPKTAGNNVPVSPRDFLKSVGINVSLNGSRWLVLSSGAAAVKAGDVIESVNSKTGLLHILRDGKAIQVFVR